MPNVTRFPQTNFFDWLNCYCPQSSRNDQLLHSFTITAMFIERRRITMYGGMSKWKNRWSSRPVISVPDAMPFILEKKGGIRQIPITETKGATRIERNSGLSWNFDRFCVWLTEIRKILLQNLKAFVTGILQVFLAPPKGMKLMTSRRIWLM